MPTAQQSARRWTKDKDTFGLVGELPASKVARGLLREAEKRGRGKLEWLYVLKAAGMEI